jgi:hypothetical protein
MLDHLLLHRRRTLSPLTSSRRSTRLKAESSKASHIKMSEENNEAPPTAPPAGEVKPEQRELI